MIKFECIFLLIFLISTLISAENSTTVDPETAKKRIDCVEKCGGGQYLKDVINKGGLLCVSNWLGYTVETHAPCLLECMGMKPDKDQRDCLSDYCEEQKNFPFFCYTIPGYNNDIPIKDKEKCEMVASGEARYSQKCDFSKRDTESRNALENAKYFDCVEKCGGVEHNNEMYANGHALCVTEGVNAGTSCVLDCLGWKPDLDQLKCWARYCQKFPGGVDKFCREPKGNRIQRNECDTLAGSGEAKPYGNCA